MKKKQGSHKTCPCPRLCPQKASLQSLLLKDVLLFSEINTVNEGECVVLMCLKAGWVLFCLITFSKEILLNCRVQMLVHNSLIACYNVLLFCSSSGTEHTFKKTMEFQANRSPAKCLILMYDFVLISKQKCSQLSLEESINTVTVVFFLESLTNISNVRLKKLKMNLDSTQLSDGYSCIFFSFL